MKGYFSKWISWITFESWSFGSESAWAELWGRLPEEEGLLLIIMASGSTKLEGSCDHWAGSHIFSNFYIQTIPWTKPSVPIPIATTIIWATSTLPPGLTPVFILTITVTDAPQNSLNNLLKTWVRSCFISDFPWHLQWNQIPLWPDQAAWLLHPTPCPSLLLQPLAQYSPGQLFLVLLFELVKLLFT